MASKLDGRAIYSSNSERIIDCFHIANHSSPMKMPKRICRRLQELAAFKIQLLVEAAKYVLEQFTGTGKRVGPYASLFLGYQ
jgi:hypothetical protein